VTVSPVRHLVTSGHLAYFAETRELEPGHHSVAPKPDEFFPAGWQSKCIHALRTGDSSR